MRRKRKIIIISIAVIVAILCTMVFHITFRPRLAPNPIILYLGSVPAGTGFEYCVEDFAVLKLPAKFKLFLS